MINAKVVYRNGDKFVNTYTGCICVTATEMAILIEFPYNDYNITHEIIYNGSIIFNPNNVCYKGFLIDYKAKVAALRGFVRTENIDVELPPLPETLANTLAINRNNDFGEVLNIINQCKWYIKSLLAYCTTERIKTVFSLFELVEAQISFIEYNIVESKNEYIVIDSNNVLKEKGFTWLITQLRNESNSLYNPTGLDYDTTHIDTIRFTYLDNVFSIKVKYTLSEIVEMILL